MKDQFVLLLNNSYLNSGIPRNSGQFTADQTFHYIESTLYIFSRIFLDLNLGVKILSLTDMDKNVNQWSLQISWQPSKHDITHGPISLDFFLMSNTGFIQWKSIKSTIISYF